MFSYDARQSLQFHFFRHQSNKAAYDQMPNTGLVYNGRHLTS
jgi:hypothetical protein